MSWLGTPLPLQYRVVVYSRTWYLGMHHEQWYVHKVTQRIGYVIDGIVAVLDLLACCLSFIRSWRLRLALYFDLVFGSCSKIDHVSWANFVFPIVALSQNVCVWNFTPGLTHILWAWGETICPGLGHCVDDKWRHAYVPFDSFPIIAKAKREQNGEHTVFPVQLYYLNFTVDLSFWKSSKVLAFVLNFRFYICARL